MTRKSPFFFLIKKVGEVYGDLDFLMKFFPRFSSIHPLRNSGSLADIGYILHENMSGTVGLKSIGWSSSRVGGKRLAASSEKTSAKSLYCAGMDASVISFFPSWVFWAHC